MKLLDRSGYRPDDFSRDGATAAILAPLADLQVALDKPGRGPVGVEIANNTDVERLAPFFEKLALIAVAFPAYTDGRGFSLARRLRRSGFKGRLRAVGPLIPDQGPYAFACGFDEIELPETSVARQTEAQWKQALSTITFAYQPGYARPESILQRRLAAREGARHG